LVAKGLDSQISMGDHMLGPRKSNPHGHYENWAFIKLNGQILRRAGGDWDSPPPRKAILQAGTELSNKIERTVQEASRGHDLWGWKDPRTTLTIECYLPFIENPHFVCVFRSPEEVARSLKRRNGFDLDRGLALAREYNTRLLRFLESVT
jgi:hypothetical protein